MIITISGPCGSGKSTIAKAIQKEFNTERIYVGGMRREYATKLGMSLNELNKYALEHPESDVKIDNIAAQKARELSKNNIVVVEGRTQYHFLPESLKLYIKCDMDAGAKRIWNHLKEDKSRNEGKADSVEELKKLEIEREQNDLARYKKYYNIDHNDESQYDHVIDTTNITADQATEKILELLRNNLKS